MQSDVIVLLSATLLNFFLSSFVLLRNRRSKINQAFGLFSGSIIVWTIMNFAADNASSQNLLYTRLTMALGVCLASSMFLLSTRFPHALGFGGKKRQFFVGISLFVFLASLTPLVVSGVEKVDHGVSLSVGPLYTLYGVYLIGGLSWGLLNFYRQYRTGNPREKLQVRIIATGILLYSSFAIFSNVILPMIINDWSPSRFGPAFTVPFVAITAYAIIRHGLFDIRLALTRTIGFIVTIGFVAAAYTGLVIALSTALLSDGDIQITRDPEQALLLVGPALFIGLTFHTIQSFIARLTQTIFYQDHFELREVLDTLSDGLVASTDVRDIMQSSMRVISGAIRPSHSYFVVFDDHGRVHHTIVRGTKAPDSTAEIVGDLKQLRENPVVRELLEEVPQSLVRSDVFLALRLGQTDTPEGLLLFGPKQNGRSYTQQDIDLLRISAKNLTVALENAKKYEQISQFADKLRKEVLAATADLRKANAELKTLDVMKDDFISMASHQLRTPASSVNQALHMLNHPDMKLSKEEKLKLLELAEASSEHLVTVVADMLSISRIQAGHFTISPSRVVFQETLDKVLKQTAVLAEQKGIALKATVPKEPITIDMDVAKVTEALSNYIENAIKYSPEKTRVEVRVSVDKKMLVFEVSDQGMGVPEPERKNLFGRFYRAANARQQQPDGNGIGLFVVRSIAEGHGGKAYYKPLTKGSLFGLHIPLTNDQDAYEKNIKKS